MKKTLLLLSLMLTGYLVGYSQQVISSSGGIVSGESSQLSWTFGETFIKTMSTEDCSLTQGVQQNNLLITVLDEEPVIETDIVAYPNPVKDIFTIEFKDKDAGEYSYKLMDINGRQIETKQVFSDKTEINISRVDAGVYYLNIINNKESIKKFKIVKQ